MISFAVVAACLILNALLSCFEMALVSVSKTELRTRAQRGQRGAETALSLRENPERALSTLQVGITLVGLISAAVGGADAGERLAPYYIRAFGISPEWAEGLAIATVVAPLAILNVVLGELVPKTLALRHPARIAMLGARPITIADRVVSPLVTFLEVTTKLIVKLFPQGRRGSSGQDGTDDVAIDHLPRETQQYVWNLVSAEDRRVRELAVPWDQVTKAPLSASQEEVTAIVIKSGHTRLPVVDGDEVVGLLHTKEFIALGSLPDANWRSLIRPLLEVSEAGHALKALRTMQRQRSHMAIVRTAERRILGIITLTDIVKFVVGELGDEDDDGRVAELIATTRQRLGLRPPKPFTS